MRGGVRFGKWVSRRLDLLRLEPVDLAFVATRVDTTKLMLKRDTLSGINRTDRRAIAALLLVPVQMMEHLWMGKIGDIPDDVRYDASDPARYSKRLQRRVEPLDQSRGLPWVGRVLLSKAKAEYDDVWDEAEGQTIPVRMPARKLAYVVDTPREFLVYQMLTPFSLMGLRQRGGGEVVLQYGEKRDWQAFVGYLTLPEPTESVVGRFKIDLPDADREKVGRDDVARVSRLLRRLPRNEAGKLDLRKLKGDSFLEIVRPPKGIYYVTDDGSQWPQEAADLQEADPPELPGDAP